MGVIRKEGIKQSIVTYFGVLFGIANTMYFYPKYFLEEELGLFRFLIETTTLLFPLIGLGINNLAVRMFPTFKNKENGHNGLLFFLVLGVLIGFGIFLLGTWIGFPYISNAFKSKSVYIEKYWVYVIPLSGLTVLSIVFSKYILNFKKVLIPSIANDIYIKLGLPLIAVALYFDVFSIREGLFAMIGIYLLRCLTLIGYTMYLKEWHWKPNWSFLSKPLVKEMRTYSLYGVFGSLGGIVATRIDIFMIAILATNDLKDVGIYSIVMFIAHVISIPSRAINNISSPIIADSWEKQDIQNIQTIYSKSSIVLLTLGLFFLIGIWSSIDDLFRLMPNGEVYAAGKYVVLILGIGKIVDLATGVNNQIIQFSKYFRFNFYAVFILAIANVIANFIFIPIYQINGAALATTASLTVFNVSKYIYLKHKMKIQPFSINTLKVLGIGVVAYLLGTIVPTSGHAFLDIIVRSSVISAAYLLPIFYFKVSPDLNDLFFSILRKIGITKN